MIERAGPTSFQHCWQVRRALQSYLDGALPRAAAEQVAEHLASCDACAREARTYQAIKDSLARRRSPSHAAVQRLREFGAALIDESDCR